MNQHVCMKVGLGVKRLWVIKHLTVFIMTKIKLVNQKVNQCGDSNQEEWIYKSIWSWTSQNEPFQPPESVFQVRHPEVFSLSIVSSELSGMHTWSYSDLLRPPDPGDGRQISSPTHPDAALLQVKILVSHNGASFCLCEHKEVQRAGRSLKVLVVHVHRWTFSNPEPRPRTLSPDAKPARNVVLFTIKSRCFHDFGGNTEKQSVESEPSCFRASF